MSNFHRHIFVQSCHCTWVDRGFKMTDPGSVPCFHENQNAAQYLSVSKAVPKWYSTLVTSSETLVSFSGSNILLITFLNKSYRKKSTSPFVSNFKIPWSNWEGGAVLSLKGQSRIKDALKKALTRSSNTLHMFTLPVFGLTAHAQFITEWIKINILLSAAEI